MLPASRCPYRLPPMPGLCSSLRIPRTPSRVNETHLASRVLDFGREQRRHFWHGAPWTQSLKYRVFGPQGLSADLLAKAPKKLYKSVLRCNEAGNKYGPFYFKRLSEVLPHYRKAFDKTPKLEGGSRSNYSVDSKGMNIGQLSFSQVLKEFATCFKPEQLTALAESFRRAGQTSLESKDFKHAQECFLHAFKLTSEENLPLKIQDGYKSALALISLGNHKLAIEQLDSIIQSWQSQPDIIVDKSLYQAIMARLYALKGTAYVYLAMTYSSGVNMKIGGEKSFDAPLKLAKGCFNKALELEPNNLYYKVNLKMIKKLCYGAEYGSPHKDLQSTNDSFPIVKMLEGVRKHLDANSKYTTVTYNYMPHWHYDENLKSTTVTYTPIPEYHDHPVPINYKMLIDLETIKKNQISGKKIKIPKLPLTPKT